ncbi:MAG TPA: DMT family transporter [Candidatus Acidoferrum sp.]|nr:DMT family transporter [Candidatus Acidoferrum sp.]
MTDKNSRISAMLIVAAGVLWGGIGLFVAMLTNAGLTRLQIVALRLVTAAVVFSAATALRSPAKFRFRWRDAWCFAGNGLLSLVFSNFCYFTAIERLSLSAAVVLLYTSPIFVTFFSVLLFGEKLTGRKVAALAITTAGCVLVTGLLESAPGEISLIGIVSGLAAGLTYGLYTIFTRCALTKGYDPAAITLHSFLWAGAGALPLSGFWRTPELLAMPVVWAGALGLGVVCCIAPYWLYNKGLSGTEPSKAAIYATVEPAVATIGGVFVLHEAMTALKLAGMALVFASLFILSRGERPKQPSEEQSEPHELQPVDH